MTSWREIAPFFRFAVYSFLTFASLVGAWIGLDLPKVASQGYVDEKFRPVQSQLTSTRLQINKMTRQNLEAEKYRLHTQVNLSGTTLDIEKRLKDIDEELADTADERKRLLGPSN